MTGTNQNQIRNIIGVLRHTGKASHHDRQQLAAWIASERKRLRLKQSELASLAGVGIRTISNLENGGVPNSQQVLQIALALDTLATTTTADAVDGLLRVDIAQAVQQMLIPPLQILPPDMQGEAFQRLSKVVAELLQEATDRAQSSQNIGDYPNI